MPVRRILCLALAAPRSLPLPRQRCPSRSSNECCCCNARRSRSLQKEGGPIQAPQAIRHRTALSPRNISDAPSSSATSTVTGIELYSALYSSSATGRAPTAPKKHILTCATKQRSKGSPSPGSPALRVLSTSLRTCTSAQQRKERVLCQTCRKACQNVRSRSPAGEAPHPGRRYSPRRRHSPGTPPQRDRECPVPEFCAQRTSRSQADRIPGQAAISGPPRWNFHLIYAWGDILSTLIMPLIPRPAGPLAIATLACVQNI